MRIPIANFVLGLFVIFLITIYSLSASGGGDIIFMFLTSIFVILDFFVLKFLLKLKPKIYQFLIPLSLVFVCAIVFTYLNYKRSEIKTNISAPFQNGN